LGDPPPDDGRLTATLMPISGVSWPLLIVRIYSAAALGLIAVPALTSAQQTSCTRPAPGSVVTQPEELRSHDGVLKLDLTYRSCRRRYSEHWNGRGQTGQGPLDQLRTRALPGLSARDDRGTASRAAIMARFECLGHYLHRPADIGWERASIHRRGVA
jgi:hypothetical protein